MRTEKHFIACIQAHEIDSVVRFLEEAGQEKDQEHGCQGERFRRFHLRRADLDLLVVADCQLPVQWASIKPLMVHIFNSNINIE
jgi:hypothetical protein